VHEEADIKSCCSPTNFCSFSNTANKSAFQGTKSASAIELAQIDAGSFLMGSESAEAMPTDGEGPVREEFLEFIESTGYVTEAEEAAWSFVFVGQLSETTRKENVLGFDENLSWWAAVRGACWKHPTGPSSSIEQLLDHPVVHISWNDASAYAQWAGKRLPTEAEWEKAARGYSSQQNFAWGESLELDGRHMCNVWQGEFPVNNSLLDGHYSTAPVRSFEANSFGLYNVSGNVWEWTADWYSSDWHANQMVETRVNPTGPATGVNKVTKGGSFLCHASYCNRYRLSARSSSAPSATFSHTGFRVASDLV
jgi:formylglycine-generating enzyme required for sulfatase activity